MKVLVWQCEECNMRCIAKFSGSREGYYKRLKRPFESCIWEEGVGWMDKNPWKLRRIDESEIVQYFLKGNEKWIKNKAKLDVRGYQ